MAGGFDRHRLGPCLDDASLEGEAREPLGREIGESRAEIVASEDETNRHRMIADLHGLSRWFGP